MQLICTATSRSNSRGELVNGQRRSHHRITELQRKQWEGNSSIWPVVWMWRSPWIQSPTIGISIQFSTVILSEVAVSRSEAATQSKDPLQPCNTFGSSRSFLSTLPTPCLGRERENSFLRTRRRSAALPRHHQRPMELPLKSRASARRKAPQSRGLQ